MGTGRFTHVIDLVTTHVDVIRQDSIIKGNRLTLPFLNRVQNLSVIVIQALSTDSRTREELSFSSISIGTTIDENICPIGWSRIKLIVVALAREYADVSTPPTRTLMSVVSRYGKLKE